jgi:hypothetical protein
MTGMRRVLYQVQSHGILKTFFLFFASLIGPYVPALQMLVCLLAVDVAPA